VYGSGGDARGVAPFHHAADHEATRGHRLLAVGVPAKGVRHEGGAE